MAKIDTADLISISEASRRGVSALVRAAEEGHEPIVPQNSKPVAAVVSIERLERLEQLQHLEDEVLDATLVAARIMTSGAHRHSLDDVLARFGYARDDLRDPTEQPA